MEPKADWGNLDTEQIVGVKAVQLIRLFKNFIQAEEVQIEYASGHKKTKKCADVFADLDEGPINVCYAKCFGGLTANVSEIWENENGVKSFTVIMYD